MTVKNLINKFPDNFLVEITSSSMQSSGYAKSYKVVNKPDELLDSTSFTWEVIFNTDTNAYWLIIRA